MDAAAVEANLARAESLIVEAGNMARKFLEGGERGSYDEVMEQADPITDRLEEAQQILLETEVDDLPEATTPGEDADDSPELEVEGEAYDLSMKKQQLEHDSRLLESAVYRAAANLVGKPLDGTGKLDEQQDQLLSAACTALEAALGTKADPTPLIRLAEVRLLQREVKKANEALEVAIKLDPEGAGGSRAQEMLERIAGDPNLKDRGKCFIATAACESPESPEVVELRRFRDQVLQRTGPGRLLVSAYYAFSPPLARALSNNQTAARIARNWVVRPLAGVASAVTSPKGGGPTDNGASGGIG